MTFLNTAGTLTALLYGCASVCGQTVSIPFIGCPSAGQMGELKAPVGTSKRVRVSQQDARALAFYKSANGISVLAPRGWYCQGASGSGGAVLLLGPRPIVYTSSGWDGLGGPAIEVSHISGEASGRYEIAELIARVFPAYREFARQIWDFDSPLPAGPYPTDALTYRGNAVRYSTPAQTDGLGNFHSWLGKNDLPIAGVAILLGSPRTPENVPDVMLLSARLPPDIARLAPVMIRYVEREAVRIAHK